MKGVDLEGATCDPNSGLLYLGVEGEEEIIEVDPGKLEVLRTFTIERTLEGRVILAEGGHGIEGITFVPDPEHPHGGTFYVTNQGFDSSEEDDRSLLVELEVELRAPAASSARPIRAIDLKVIDLSGIHYHADTDRLYVISDATNSMLEVNRKGEVERAYAFPGANQEGVAVDPAGYVYIAQDSGGLIKIKWESGED